VCFTCLLRIGNLVCSTYSEHAEHTRRAEVATTLAGAVISTIGLGLASTWRPRRRASLISLVGFVLAFGSFLLVIGNAIE
jgi:hypothetical protein